MKEITSGISVIVPTIGRPASLERLLASIARQTRPVLEVVVADGSSERATRELVESPRWRQAGLLAAWIEATPPNAVRQRRMAIDRAYGDLLLFLDDDVVLDPMCIEKMSSLLAIREGVVAVVASFSNESWSSPTRAWAAYLRLFHGVAGDSWQGRVIGPLLRFGFSPVPAEPCEMQWMGAGNSMVRRSAYEQCGGFSTFFLRRSTMNEDVDLGLRLSRVGQILFCPEAKMEHHHAAGGRVSVAEAAQDDVYNRFVVLHRTVGSGRLKAFLQVCLFVAVESGSNLLGSISRRRVGTTPRLIQGRLAGLFSIARSYFVRGRRELL